MSHFIRHTATGLYFCDEPYVTLKTGGDLGTWSVVERIEDATPFKSRNRAVREGHSRGIDSKHWEITEQVTG